MKWPWVSRALHESYERQLERQYAINRDWSRLATDFDNQLADEQRRYDDLLAKYHALRLQGYAEPPAPVVINRAAPDPVKQAIANAAGTDRALRMQMERQAAVDAAAGVSRDEIVLRIAKGTSVDESFGVSV